MSFQGKPIPWIWKPIIYTIDIHQTVVYRKQDAAGFISVVVKHTTCMC